MLRFNNDYNEGAHESILKKLAEINMNQIGGYDGGSSLVAKASQLLFNDKPSRIVQIFGTIRRYLISSDDDYSTYSIRVYPHYSMVHLFLSIWGFILGVVAVMLGIAGLVIH